MNENLDEHYVKIDTNRTENINLLAKKAQLNKGYSGLEQ